MYIQVDFSVEKNILIVVWNFYLEISATINSLKGK